MSWTDTLKSFAPTVASALGGPVAGVAVAAIAKLFGVEESTEAVAKAINDGKMTPDQIAEIKKLELELRKQERELGFKYSELEFKDRDSARNMQIATRSNMPAVLTVLTTIGFFGVLYAMFVMPELKESAPLMIMLGQLSAGWASSLAFWLGTTSSSGTKTEMLARAEPMGR